MLRILGDCVGTRAHVDLLSTNKISVQYCQEPLTRADWTSHDYNVHFSFGLANEGRDQIEVMIEVGGGNFESLPDIFPNLYISEYPDREFERFNGRARTDKRKRYAIKLIIAAGARCYLANTIVRSLSNLIEEFDSSGKIGRAHV